MKDDEPLPTPRDLLTSLITSLSSIPLADSNNNTLISSSHRPSAVNAGASSSSSSSSSTNPLRLIPPAYRSILTTLHVIYPTTLLPALDLLDKRLVTRVVLDRATASASTQDPNSAHVQTVNKEEEEADPSTRPPDGERGGGATALFHLVHSAQQPQSHRRRHHPHPEHAAGRAYVVQLESWNCSCAAFAFSAFPPLPPLTTRGGYEILPAATPSPSSMAKDEDVKMGGGGDDDAEDSHEKEEEALKREQEPVKWEFGGLSTDGKGDRGGAGVPCCKHLLACVLAERWSAALGGYVQERRVSGEEAAGLVAEL